MYLVSISHIVIIIIIINIIFFPLGPLVPLGDGRGELALLYIREYQHLCIVCLFVCLFVCWMKLIN